MTGRPLWVVNPTGSAYADEFFMVAYSPSELGLLPKIARMEKKRWMAMI
jgi:hypothetical protein